MKGYDNPLHGMEKMLVDSMLKYGDKEWEKNPSGIFLICTPDITIPDGLVLSHLYDFEDVESLSGPQQKLLEFYKDNRGNQLLSEDGYEPEMMDFYEIVSKEENDGAQHFGNGFLRDICLFVDGCTNMKVPGGTCHNAGAYASQFDDLKSVILSKTSFPGKVTVFAGGEEIFGSNYVHKKARYPILPVMKPVEEELILANIVPVNQTL